MASSSEHIDLNQLMAVLDHAFPYRSVLSLEYIIDGWRQKAVSDDAFLRQKAELVLQLIESNPVLQKPELKTSDLDGLDHVIKHIFSDLYSIDLDDTQAFAVSAPFTNDFVFQTSRFKEIINNIHISPELLEQFSQVNPKALNAFAAILNNIYDAGLDQVDVPFVIPSRDANSGLTKYYKVHVDNMDFTKVIHVGSRKKINRDFIQQLLHHNGRIEEWFEQLPPEDFIFKGVVLIKLRDITEQDVLNRIQSTLLQSSIITPQRLAAIASLCSDYLEVPDIRIGLSGLDKEGHALRAEQQLGLSHLSSLGITLSKKWLAAEVLPHFQSDQPLLIVDSRSKSAWRKKTHAKLVKSGAAALILAPLYKSGRLIGLLELILPENQLFSAFRASKLAQLIPTFELAFDRSIENVNNKIQHIIKDNCTAIHPSVEWKFFTAAIKAYRKQLATDEAVSMPPIQFKDVIPLYGLSDIRNSSTVRLRVIREDLLAQLTYAKETFEALRPSEDLIVFNNIIYQIEQKQNALRDEQGFSQSEDMYGFLETDVNKLLRKLRKDHRFDHQVIEGYLGSLHPELGILYEKRKHYDESVRILNERIGHLLDSEQERIQRIYPHYFEKYKTDGVDFNLYIGQSISPDIPYHHIYLRNLRLWQLATMCKISHLSHALVRDLPLPLETAELILAQNSPINIRFRYEEKRFDIDGAYNARYEIVKKRIDKATVAQTGERLTMPGKIAIVYNHNQVLKEYLAFAEFLQSEAILLPDIEYLELAELKGANDLRALRFTVNRDAKILADDVFADEILRRIST